MTVILFKNGTPFKRFRKYFDWFVKHEIEEWTATHFVNAKEKKIDFKFNTICIYY